MKYIYFILILLMIHIGSCHTWAQEPEKIVQLKEQIYQERADTANVINYFRLSHFYHNISSDSALHYIELALKLSQKINFVMGINNSLNVIADLMVQHGNYDSAFACLDMMDNTPLDDSIGVFRTKSRTNLRRGVIYKNQGLLNKSLNAYQNSLDLTLRANDSTMLSSIYNSIGIVYINLNMDSLALVYFLKAYNQALNRNEIRIINKSLNGIGGVYLRNKQYNEALETYFEVVKHANENGLNFDKGNALFNIGVSYQRMGELEKAKKYLNQGLAIYQEFNELRHEQSAYDNLIEILIHEGELNKALEMAYRKREIAKKLNSIADTRDAYKILGDLKTMQAEYKTAAEYYNLSRAYNDTLYQNNFQEEIAKKRNNIELLETSYENKLLRQQNAYISLKAREVKLRNRYSLIIGLLLIALLLTIVIWLSYRLRVNRLKTELHQKQLSEVESNQRIMAMKSMIQGQEKEQQRIARDLHDDLGSQLATIKLHIDSLSDSMANELKSTSKQIDTVYQDVRRISHNLMPLSLSKLGIIAAIRELKENIENTGTLLVNLDIDAYQSSLSNEEEILLYRVFQEAVKNIIKHAKASELTIQLFSNNDTIAASIEDNGVGFNVSTSTKKQGHGLSNMHNRVKILGGTIDIQSKPEHGTSIYIEIPNRNE